MMLAMMVRPPGSGAIPPHAARGIAGAGRPGNLEGPIAASSVDGLLRHAQVGSQFLHRQKPVRAAHGSRAAGSPVPRGSTLTSRRVVKRGCPGRSSRQPPAAAGAALRCGAGQGAGFPGGGRRRRAGSSPCPSSCAGRGAARAGLPPGTGDIQRRLSPRCQADSHSRQWAWPGAASRVPRALERRGRPSAGCPCPARTRRTCAAGARSGGTGLGTAQPAAVAGHSGGAPCVCTMNGGENDLLAGQYPGQGEHGMKAWQYDMGSRPAAAAKR